MKINTLVIITLMIELTGCAAMKSELAYRFKLASCVSEANGVMNTHRFGEGKDRATITCERLLINENPHPETVYRVLGGRDAPDKYLLADTIKAQNEREKEKRRLIINKLVKKAQKELKQKTEVPVNE
ncbi:hypothetical protein [Methylomicrobium lacus]|uniref:hypothetical protein n=1 Tax=Methylomicrobium lacus TaxID=136992 RepID=UPI001269273F|nr:hypothetical protein [Methylomicrobium lacus]